MPASLVSKAGDSIRHLFHVHQDSISKDPTLLEAEEWTLIMSGCGIAGEAMQRLRHRAQGW